MAPRIKKIIKRVEPDIIEIDDDVQELSQTTEEIEQTISPKPVAPSDLQARLDAILEASKSVPVAPEAIAQVETLPAKVRKERKKKAEAKDAVIHVRSSGVDNDGEVWAEVRYAIDAQRTYTLGAKRKLHVDETMSEAHAKLYKQVLDSILTLV